MAISRNDHTGATLVSKANSKEYEAGYEAIFGNKDKLPIAQAPVSDLKQVANTMALGK